MAVRIDVEAFQDSIPTAVGEAAARLLSEGSVEKLEPAGGGVQALVRDQDSTVQPWVGIVDGIFASDCDCGIFGAELCAHAVATALTAFSADVAFSGAATPPGADPAEPEFSHYLEAVRRLPPRQLAELVAEHATRDRLFATRLLGEAGMLDADDETVLVDLRAAVRYASQVTAGSEWHITEVETAGHRLATEVEILCAHPANPAALDLVEEAILGWDELSGHLTDAYDRTHSEPEEITESLVYAHRDLCERLDLAPNEIAERLNLLAGRCRHVTVDVDRR